MIPIAGYDWWLQPPPQTEEPQVCGMLEAADGLKQRLQCLQDELERVDSLALLPFQLQELLRDYYQKEVMNRQNELRDILLRLSVLGYMA